MPMMALKVNSQTEFILYLRNKNKDAVAINNAQISNFDESVESSLWPVMDNNKIPAPAEPIRPVATDFSPCKTDIITALLRWQQKNI